MKGYDVDPYAAGSSSFVRVPRGTHLGSFVTKLGGWGWPRRRHSDGLPDKQLTQETHADGTGCEKGGKRKELHEHVSQG